MTRVAALKVYREHDLWWVWCARCGERVQTRTWSRAMREATFWHPLGCQALQMPEWNERDDT